MFNLHFHFVACLFTSFVFAAPITPREMQQRMGIGINLGNTLDAPTEGAYAPKAQALFFDQYKAKNFTNVRIPVQWGHHLSTTPPYTVNETFMARVEQVVNWSLERDLVTVLNTHHDEWFENNFPSSLPRFTALWEQISIRFANKSEILLFEVYNEPHAASFTADDLNQMNAAVLPIIRQHNPTRIVLFGGLKFMNPSWIIGNPDLLNVPTNDTQLMLEIHNYDPYKYAGMNPTVHSWGSVADVASLNAWMDAISAWSKKKGLPIYYGEWGCTIAQTKATGRYDWYLQHAMSIRNHGFAASVWDDDGKYQVYDRAGNSWDDALLQALGK